MDMYEKAWAGKHGKEYSRRCNVYVEHRIEIFENLLIGLPEYTYSQAGSKHGYYRKPCLDSILEVGCNKGHNLDAISTTGIRLGIEINKELCTRPDIIHGSAYELPWSDNVFSLVFTAGVLIHIPPAKLRDAMEEMRRVSSKYVMMIEYFSEEEKGTKYQEDFNHQDGVWSRPYGKIYQEYFPEDKLIEHGKISDIGDDGWGFSKCDYWIFEKVFGYKLSSDNRRSFC